jgi:Helix-turn-helix domain
MAGGIGACLDLASFSPSAGELPGSRLMYEDQPRLPVQDPTPEQANAFARNAGVCRLVYNIALEQRGN